MLFVEKIIIKYLDERINLLFSNIEINIGCQKQFQLTGDLNEYIIVNDQYEKIERDRICVDIYYEEKEQMLVRKVLKRVFLSSGSVKIEPSESMKKVHDLPCSNSLIFFDKKHLYYYVCVEGIIDDQKTFFII